MWLRFEQFGDADPTSHAELETEHAAAPGG